MTRHLIAGCVAIWSLMLSCALTVAGEPLDVVLAPRGVSVERTGLTGGGTPVVSGKRILLFYPNHPDDFGASNGTGTSLSEDGGLNWLRGMDDWPIAKTADLWADRLRNGDLLAFGLHWLPDPKQRATLTAKDVPVDAYSMAISNDQGRTWQQHRAVIEYTDDRGVIARPLPHIIETADGTLLMPAYVWSKSGHAMVLLKSATPTDGGIRGQRWTVASTICTSAAITKLGIPVSTPWLETTVAITSEDGTTNKQHLPTRSVSEGLDGRSSDSRDGIATYGLLAAIRTSSNSTAQLVSVRSTDGGKTWLSPEALVAGPDRRPITGKLPTLARLPSGPLVLMAAHSKNHCRVYISDDGTGRSWSAPQIITSQSGGNAGLAITSDNSFLISTPMNGRLNAWRATLRKSPPINPDLASPTSLEWQRGTLIWKPVPNATAYRVTPILITSNASAGEMESAPYSPTETANNTPQLDLSRRLILGATYQFEVSTIAPSGQLSRPALSERIVVSQ